MTRFLPLHCVLINILQHPLLIWITVIIAAADATLPPNTGAVLVADVAGTKAADDTFWAEACKVIPQATALYIIVKIERSALSILGTHLCEILSMMVVKCTA